MLDVKYVNKNAQISNICFGNMEKIVDFKTKKA